MSKQPKQFYPVHRSVCVTSAGVSDILKEHYGITAPAKLVTAWYRLGLIPASKSGEGKKATILFEVGDVFDAIDRGIIPRRTRKPAE